MTEETRVIKVYEPFILGKCQCGHCNEDIEIIDRDRKILKKYYKTHRPRGSDSPFWKGGRWVNEFGYVFVWAPEHPKADKRGYVFEHVKVITEYYNCCLLPWTQIHHIDKNTQNNEISNLLLTRNGLHRSTYHLKDMSDRVCLLCGAVKTYIDKLGIPRWSIYKNGFICNKCDCKERRRKKFTLTPQVQATLVSFL